MKRYVIFVISYCTYEIGMVICGLQKNAKLAVLSLYLEEVLFLQSKNHTTIDNKNS